MDEKKFQIIYSLRVMKGLVSKGLFPVQTMPNPINSKFNCWVFEDTENFRRELSAFYNN